MIIPGKQKPQKIVLIKINKKHKTIKTESSSWKFYMTKYFFESKNNILA